MQDLDELTLIQGRSSSHPVYGEALGPNFEHWPQSVREMEEQAERAAEEGSDESVLGQA